MAFEVAFRNTTKNRRLLREWVWWDVDGRDAQKGLTGLAMLIGFVFALRKHAPTVAAQHGRPFPAKGCIDDG